MIKMLVRVHCLLSKNKISLYGAASSKTARLPVELSIFNSILSGQGSTLVGVMVAAALLPPLIRSGLLVGGADYKNALNSFLIFSTNIVCLNIAGIITFYLAGIRPRRWWEKEIANKKTRSAFIVWTLALMILIITIMLFRKFG